MKTISLIPKEVQKLYNIKKDKDHDRLYICTPNALINIDIDEKFLVKISEITIDIINDKYNVTLYRKFQNMLITIY